MPKNGFKFCNQMRVRWSDCDAQGIAFNGAYLDFLEVALAEYFRNIGIRLYDEKSREYFDTATVKVTLEYKSPVLVDDVIDVYFRVSNVGNTSFTTNGEIYREGTEELLFASESVYVDYDSVQRTSRQVPDDVRELIDHFEATGEVLPIERFPTLDALR